MRFRTSRFVVSGLLLALCAACGTDPFESTPVEAPVGDAVETPQDGPAECLPLIRLDETTYSAYGYTTEKPNLSTEAEVADCNDVNPDLPFGSVFPTTPQTTSAGPFDGLPPSEVVGTRFNDELFAVFIADTVPRARGDAIYRQLLVQAREGTAGRPINPARPT